MGIDLPIEKQGAFWYVYFCLCGNYGKGIKVADYHIHYYVLDPDDSGWIAVLYDGVRFSDESG